MRVRNFVTWNEILKTICLSNGHIITPVHRNHVAFGGKEYDFNSKIQKTKSKTYPVLIELSKKKDDMLTSNDILQNVITKLLYRNQEEKTKR